MFTEEDLLPLSGLQHLLFCERQWALIHIEQEWEENRFTAEGRVLHDRADEPGVESRGDLRIVRALHLRSLRLGISGVADVVEFHRAEGAEAETVELQGVGGRWRPFPVEYKRGRPKRHRADEVQVAAQALCLEEMLGCRIASAALFYGRPRRRTEVPLDGELRDLTERLCGRMHSLFSARLTPPAIYEQYKCSDCSLIGVCNPRATRGPAGPASAYVERMLSEAMGESALSPEEDPL